MKFIALIFKYIVFAAIISAFPALSDARTQLQASEHSESSVRLNQQRAKKHNLQQQISSDMECTNHDPKHKSRECRDLFAQEQVAIWAKPTFFVSLATAVISFIGLGGLFWTLLQDRKSQQREFRAYVKIVFDPEEPANVIDGRRVEIPYVIENYGRTPAIQVRTWSIIVIRPSEWTWDAEPLGFDDFKDRRMVLQPGIPVNAEGVSEFEICKEAIQQLRSGLTCIFARFVVEYTTVFGAKARTVACLEFTGEKCFERWRWRVAADGDEAT